MVCLLPGEFKICLKLWLCAWVIYDRDMSRVYNIMFHSQESNRVWTAVWCWRCEASARATVGPSCLALSWIFRRLWPRLPGQGNTERWTDVAGGVLNDQFDEANQRARETRQPMMTSSNGNIFRVTGHLCGEFTGPRWIPAQRPVTQSFDVFFDLSLNKRLSKQSWSWWFETLSCSLWRHCNAELGERGVISFELI